MRLKTINVVEIFGGVLNSVRAFTIDTDGIREAERVFRLLAIHDGCPTSELDACVENGYYERNEKYQVILTHSVT